MRKLSEQEVELIEHLKQGFSGSSDYLSGVNDGMYQIAQYLTLIAIPTPNGKPDVMRNAKIRHIKKCIDDLNNDGLCGGNITTIKI